jgi:hypothetical protein
LSIRASVAFDVDHRKVADCPRSIVDGSAVKLEITGDAAGGGATGVGVGFGATGAGAGPFFLQPAAKRINTQLSTTTIIFFVDILKLPPKVPVPASIS